MKPCLVAVLGLIVVSCATLAPTEVRRAEFIIETKLPKDKAYKGALTWLAKNQGDAKAVRQVEDAAEAHFITPGRYSCNVLRQTGDINDYQVDFKMDFQAKENRVRFQFEDLQMIRKAPGGETEPMQFAYGQLVDAGKVEQIKPCLKQLAETMVQAGVERQKADNW